MLFDLDGVLTVTASLHESAWTETFAELFHGIAARPSQEPPAQITDDDYRRLVDGEPQGGTTREGVHLGAMAGTVDLLGRCYSGLEVRGEVLRLDPVLPDELAELRLTLTYRSHHLDVCVDHHQVTVASARPRRPRLHRRTNPPSSPQ